MTPEQLFEANLGVIEAAIRVVAHVYRLRPDERDDFAGDVRLRLIQNDYDILRHFEHRCHLKTYLVTVIARQYLDARNKTWGKWHASATAKRLGPIAVHLERLVHRDGLTFDEAAETLLNNERVDLSSQALREMWEQLPPRSPRHFVGDQDLDDVSIDEPTAEEQIAAREDASGARRAYAILERIIADLPAQDAFILKLRDRDGLSVVHIAGMLGLDKTEAKGLYRRLESIRKKVRTQLEAEGVTAAEALAEWVDERDAKEDDEQGADDEKRE